MLKNQLNCKNQLRKINNSQKIKTYFSTVSRENSDIYQKVSSRKQEPFFNPVVQPKLSINQPNDIYEQEADAMADRVMPMPDPAAGDIFFFKPARSSMQRKCVHCEEEEKTFPVTPVVAQPDSSKLACVDMTIDYGHQTIVKSNHAHRQVNI